jgi:hypothetical protein
MFTDGGFARAHQADEKKIARYLHNGHCNLHHYAELIPRFTN